VWWRTPSHPRPPRDILTSVIFREKWTANIAGQPGTIWRAEFRDQREQVAYLRQIVRAYASTMTIRDKATQIVFDIYYVPQKNQAMQAWAIGDWVQKNIKYILESEETFYTPIQTLRVGAADCDDHSTLICALCESIGIPTQLVAMGWSSGGSWGYQHIAARAAVRIGGRQRWLWMDSTLEEPIGFNPLRKAIREHRDVKFLAMR
jgi:transglutaminase-like putative cysteine protease